MRAESAAAGRTISAAAGDSTTSREKGLICGAGQGWLRPAERELVPTMDLTGSAFEDLRERLRRNPFNHWLGLDLVVAGEDGVEITAQWREEFVSNPDQRYTHGGILAALVDTAADYALAARIGAPCPTIDLRVDYHRPAMPGDLVAKGRVLRLGKQFSTAEASVFDAKGLLLASGRGVFFSGAPSA
jgi:uncharacterized protein (TIGR00369 family)